MPSELTRVFVPIAEVTKSKDDKGNDIRIVHGVMTDETVDLDDQIVDYDWAKQASAKWFKSWANIREQHSSNAVGKGIELGSRDDARAVDLGSKVVDPGAIRKLDEEILSGYSVGIKGARVVKDSKAPNGRIVGGDIVEVSLVDHPANENCKLVLVKAATSGRLEAVEQAVVEKGNAPGAMVESPLVGGLVANIEHGLNEHRTNPAGKQSELPADTAGEDLDTAPGSALRRKKKPTPEIGGKPAGLGSRQSPKAAQADIEKKVTAELTPEGKLTVWHENETTNATGPAAKGSIIDGQALPGQGGPGLDGDITSPSGATAGACPDGSCSCGGCGPSCEGTCCDDCQMGDEYDRRETLHFSASATKNITLEESEEMYAEAVKQIRGFLEKGDTNAALGLIAATDLAVEKGSIIAAQAGGTDNADEVEVVPAPATGRKRKLTPEQGGAGAAAHAPDSEDLAPTKAASADLTKAIASEVTKAVETAVKSLKDKIDELEKRAQPGGPMLGSSKLLSAPDEVKAKAFTARLEVLRDMAENHPDRSVAAGAKAAIAELEK